MKTFSNTVMPLNGWGTWWVRTIPILQRLAASSDDTSSPLKATLPAVAPCEPDKRLSKVVFPAPFGPTMPIASPRRTSKSTPSRTTSEPYAF